MSIHISLDTLPDYLRWEGHSRLADRIEQAGRDGKQLVPALEQAETELANGEAREVVRQMIRLIKLYIQEAEVRD